MQFEVPQFETEAKIFGPLGIVQFAVVSGTGIFIIILWNVLQLWLWFTTSIILAGVVLAVVMGKVRGRPMTSFLPNAINFMWQPKTYTYREPSAVVVGLKHISVPKEVKPITVISSKISPETISPYLMGAPAAEKPKPIITPKITLVEPPRETSLLRGLMNRITTTISPIPQREISIKEDELKTKRGEYEILERTTGEKEAVRRIDYRA